MRREEKKGRASAITLQGAIYLPASRSSRLRLILFRPGAVRVPVEDCEETNRTHGDRNRSLDAEGDDRAEHDHR
jgi:hypothetical protein